MGSVAREGAGDGARTRNVRHGASPQEEQVIAISGRRQSDD